METEKVCVNFPAAELGKMDVLVAMGLYSTRSDVIRAGIRQLLDAHDADYRHVYPESETRIGYQLVTREELERAREAGRKLAFVVIGILRIESAVSADLAEETIDAIRSFGSVKGPPEVLQRLEPRILRGFAAGPAG